MTLQTPTMHTSVVLLRTRLPVGEMNSDFVDKFCRAIERTVFRNFNARKHDIVRKEAYGKAPELRRGWYAVLEELR